MFIDDNTYLEEVTDICATLQHSLNKPFITNLIYI